MSDLFLPGLEPATTERTRPRPVPERGPLDWSDVDDGRTLGHRLPRLETPHDPDAPTFGPLAVEWIEETFHVRLTPWQRYVCDRLLAYEGEGASMRWVHLTALVTVARQNGKSFLLTALICWLLQEYATIVGRPIAIGFVGHQLNLSAEVHDGCRQLMLDHPWAFNLTARRDRGSGEFKFPAETRIRGAQRIELPNGSTLETQAAGRKAGHGKSWDVVLLDEIWAIERYVVEDGLEPTQMARPAPLMAAFSTAGETNASEVMQAWRRRGLQLIDQDRRGDHLLLEWSPPGDALIDEPETWAWSNPSLGYTVPEPNLRSRIEKAVGDVAHVERAILNRWVTSIRAWLPVGVWPRCADAGHEGPEDVAEGVLSVEVAHDHSAWGAVLAWTEGELVVVHAIEEAHELDLWDALDPYRRAGWTWLLPGDLYDRLPGGEHVDRDRVGVSQLQQWTEHTRRLIMGEQLAHGSQEILTDQVVRAVGVTHHQSQRLTLTEAGSGGPIHLAKCLVWSASRVTKTDHRPRPVLVTR